MPRKIEISHRTIIFTFFVIGAIWVLYLIRDILLSLFVALLIMFILNPLVRRLSKYRIPRGASVLVVYLTFFVVVGVSLASIIPPLVEQTSNFASGLPTYIENLRITSPIADQVSRQVLAQLGNVPGQIVGFAFGVVSNFLTILTILIFAFYFLLARNKLENEQINVFLGEKWSKEFAGIMDDLEVRLGRWGRGQITLMFTVGFFNYVGLTLLGIPFALPLAILAGLLEFVPYVGPILAAIPAVIIGFGISPVMGLAASALAFLIQQMENYILVPKIMEKSAGVSPVITLIALSVGFRLAGITGVLISVPVVITLEVLAKRHFLAK